MNNEMIQIAIDGEEQAFPKGTLLLTAVSALLGDRADRVLGCLDGGVVVELGSPLSKSCRLDIITYAHEEGRRIYERSLRFVLLLAAGRLFPSEQVRVLNSIGYGVSAKIQGRVLTREQVAGLEKEMWGIIKSDIPFTREHWSKAQAIDYFRAQGQEDKVRLLAFRPYDYFPMYACGGMWEYFYGAMLPSTGRLWAFSLRSLLPGFVMQMPGPDRPDIPAPSIQRPKFQAVFTQSQQWCEILDATNAADINEMIEGGRVREFIRVNETLHDRSIATVADDVSEKGARVVLIAGPSSSGKTTFTNRLKLHLQAMGLRPALISLDDFYRNRADILPSPDGTVDLEDIATLDVEFLRDCLERLLLGETVGMPRFNFPTGRREALTVPLTLAPGQPMLIEGIHGLNPALSQDLPEELTYRIYVSALACINLDDHNRIRTTDVRLLRRIVRDRMFRGTPPAQTLSMWDSVRRGEDKWIFPYQELADRMVNTTLHYELPVLKSMAYDALKPIPDDDPNHLLSRRLLKILHYFLPLPEEALAEVPPLSILREFVGGNTFYDHHP